MSEIRLTADVTGTVWKIVLRPGDVVAADDVLLILESMKMELPLTAPAAGKVLEFLVAEGEGVEEGQAIAVFKSGL
jgi:urea carboxylase